MQKPTEKKDITKLILKNIEKKTGFVIIVENQSIQNFKFAKSVMTDVLSKEIKAHHI